MCAFWIYFVARWTRAEDDVLRGGGGIRELSELLGRSYSAVRQRRRLLGLTEPAVRYSVNSGFFGSWSSEMAYVLGFVFADGYVSSDRGYLRIEIGDRGHLELLASYLGDHVVRRRGTRDIYYVMVYSRDLVRDLQALGAVQNKSLVMVFPDVPREYFWDFVRGYFDGDGSVSIVRGCLRVAFHCGSLSFVSSLMSELESRGYLLSLESIPKVSVLYRLNVLTGSFRSFYDDLYTGGPCLYRKQEVFRRFFGE